MHDGDEQLQHTRIFLRPIANPFALGFVGLAVATVITAGVELSWIPPGERVQAAVLILAFATPLQAIACVFGFLARDAVAATSMGVQSATWLCIGLSLLLSPASGTPSRALALLLFVSGSAVIFSARTALRTNVVPAAVLSLTGLRYILTGVFEAGDGTAWRHAGAWCGVVLCAAALYAVLSLELEDTEHRAVLPTLRTAKGRRLLSGHLDEQVEQVAAEAGVRSQL